MSVQDMTALSFETDQRIHIPGKDLPEWVTVRVALPNGDNGWQMFVAADDGEAQESIDTCDKMVKHLLLAWVAADDEYGSSSER
jgi:hypothetical protein